MAGVAPGHEIRPADPEDVPAIAAIYNAGIHERVATFETTERTEEDVAEWLESPLPLLVAIRNETIAGWARVGRYSARPAYDGVGEHAVYVAPNARGAGVARDLLKALADAAEEHGLHKLTSRVFTNNAPSRAAHRAAGFDEIGVHRRHAKLDGQWMDCVIVERLLGPAANA
jgi:phosphinothricin acetyltransferase